MSKANLGAKAADVFRDRLLEKTPKLEAKTITLVAEAVGTYMLVLSVGLTKIAATAGASGCANENVTGNETALGLAEEADGGHTAMGVFGPTCVGFMYMVLVYGFHGLVPNYCAQFNPAVTFACVHHKAMDLADGVKYMGVQVVAGILAGVTCWLMFGFCAVGSTGGPIGPVSADFVIGAPIVEFVYTFMLCFVVLNVCVAQEKIANNSYYGLAVGFTVIGAGYGGGYVSGGAFNPAVAIGMNIMAISAKSLMVPIYVVVQFAAGFFAVTALRIVRPKERMLGHGREELDATKVGGIIKKISHFTDKLEAWFDPEDSSEFIGTTLLVFTISLNGMLGQMGASSLAIGGVWSVGTCLMSLIYAIGDVSGGLFNPALTLAVCMRYLHTGDGFGEKDAQGKFCKICDPMESPWEITKYWFYQFVGGGAGAGLSLLVYLTALSGGWPAVRIGAKPTDPSSAACVADVDSDDCEKFTTGQAFFAEFYGTFLLCYVVLCVVTTKADGAGGGPKAHAGQYTAFCIGGCIVAAGYAFGPLSGGMLNPAVTVANGVLSKLQIIYEAGPVTFVAAQMLGGIVAAILFRFVTHRDHCDQQKAQQGTSKPLLG